MRGVFYTLENLEFQYSRACRRCDYSRLTPVPTTDLFLRLTLRDPPTAQKQITIAESAMEACIGAEGIVIATEWDEFKDLDWEKIYASMHKPAFVFDGRLILDQKKLEKIGFKVKTIGRGDVLL